VLEERVLSRACSQVGVVTYPTFSSEHERAGHDRQEVGLWNGDVYVTGGDARAGAQGGDLSRHAVGAKTEILATQSRCGPASRSEDMHVSVKAYQAVTRQFRGRCWQAASLDIVTMRVQPERH